MRHEQWDDMHPHPRHQQRAEGDVLQTGMQRSVRTSPLLAHCAQVILPQCMVDMERHITKSQLRLHLEEIDGGELIDDGTSKADVLRKFSNLTALSLCVVWQGQNGVYIHKE